LNERMLISSDAYDAPVCSACGMIGLKRNTNWSVCSACESKAEDSSIRSVQMPYVTKLLMQELMSMGIAPRIKTEVQVNS